MKRFARVGSLAILTTFLLSCSSPSVRPLSDFVRDADSFQWLADPVSTNLADDPDLAKAREDLENAGIDVETSVIQMFEAFGLRYNNPGRFELKVYATLAMEGTSARYTTPIGLAGRARGVLLSDGVAIQLKLRIERPDGESSEHMIRDVGGIHPQLERGWTLGHLTREQHVQMARNAIEGGKAEALTNFLGKMCWFFMKNFPDRSPVPATTHANRSIAMGCLEELEAPRAGKYEHSGKVRMNYRIRRLSMALDTRNSPNATREQVDAANVIVDDIWYGHCESTLDLARRGNLREWAEPMVINCEEIEGFYP